MRQSGICSVESHGLVLSSSGYKWKTECLDSKRSQCALLFNKVEDKNTTF